MDENVWKGSNWMKVDIWMKVDKMDENGWKWMKMDEGGWKWIKWMKVDKMDENGWKWMKMDKIGWKLMKVDETGWKWMKLMKMHEHWSKWTNVDERGWKLMKYPRCYMYLWCHLFLIQQFEEPRMVHQSEMEKKECRQNWNSKETNLGFMNLFHSLLFPAFPLLCPV